MTNAALAVVRRWQEAILLDPACSVAVECWHGTPPVLAARAGAALRARAVPASNESRVLWHSPAGTILRLTRSFEVGVVMRSDCPGLVSPQAVIRRCAAAGWARSAKGPVTVLVQQVETRPAAAAAAIAGMASDIASALGVDVPAFTYFIGTPPGMPAGGWSKFDPYGGDIISRLQFDVHEIGHAVAGALPGWPPPVLREGLAECCTLPIDVATRYRHERGPSVAQLIETTPGTLPGWYTGAALLTAWLWLRLGRAGFRALWQALPDTAGAEALAAALGLSQAQLEEEHAVWTAQLLVERRRVFEAGLIKLMMERIS